MLKSRLRAALIRRTMKATRFQEWCAHQTPFTAPRFPPIIFERHPVIAHSCRPRPLLLCKISAQRATSSPFFNRQPPPHPLLNNWIVFWLSESASIQRILFFPFKPLHKFILDFSFCTFKIKMPVAEDSACFTNMCALYERNFKEALDAKLKAMEVKFDVWFAYFKNSLEETKQNLAAPLFELQANCGNHNLGFIAYLKSICQWNLGKNTKINERKFEKTTWISAIYWEVAKRCWKNQNDIWSATCLSRYHRKVQIFAELPIK